MTYPQTNNDWAALTWLVDTLKYPLQFALQTWDVVEVKHRVDGDDDFDVFYGGRWYTILNKEEFL